MYTANIRSSINTVGVGWELDAVASVVIGGTIVTGGFGYVLGSVIGALVRSTIDPLTPTSACRPNGPPSWSA
mgnify:CR=1 FL=1